MNHNVMLVLVAIGLLSLVSQWLAWRIRVPAILFLLASGIIIGPVTGWLVPDELFGGLLFPFISLSVAVILFEGSLTLRRDEIKGHGDVVRNLVTFGVFVTWGVVAIVTHWVIGVAWQLAFLFGAIMTVTGPTVIMPMLQAVRPNRTISNILRWEGILIDPVGAILAVLTFQVVLASQFTTALDEILLQLARLLAAGIILGGGFGYAWGVALRRYWIPQFLQNVATLLIVFAVFAFADTVEHESGLLAVTVMGVWLANMRGVPVEDILDFKESLSVLLISGLFILLAARLNFSQLQAVGWPAVIILLSIQFLARPMKILLSSIGAKLSWQEKMTIAWIGPRGIIAAAISAVFALRLEENGVDGAAFLVPLTFVVIVGTVVFQSLTARPLARMLGVATPEPEGVLIVGANPLAIAIAKVLSENGFRVLVANNSWHSLKAVRMAGIETYYGNPVSDHAERTMDLTGIGKLFAISRNAEFNHLACAHFAYEFGRQNIYSLPVSADEADASVDKHAPAHHMRGRRLFGTDASLSKLQSLLSKGAKIKLTQLTETYEYEAYREQNGGARMDLMAWSDKGQLVAMSADANWKPGPGWTVASLNLAAE